jgi:hypothetical protein
MSASLTGFRECFIDSETVATVLGSGDWKSGIWTGRRVGTLFLYVAKWCLVATAPENYFPREKDGKRGKIWENWWRYKIQFGTLFVIATSSKSPRILKYSKDSESKLG